MKVITRLASGLFATTCAALVVDDATSLLQVHSADTGDNDKYESMRPQETHLRLAELEIGDPPDSWRMAGFEVDEDGYFMIADTRVHLVGGERRGVLGMTVEGPTPHAAIDLGGMMFTVQERTHPKAQEKWHPNGACEMSKLVIETPEFRALGGALQGVLNMTMSDVGEDEMTLENLENFEVLEIKQNPEPMGVEQGRSAVSMFVGDCDMVTMSQSVSKELLVGLRTEGARPLITFKAFQVGMSVNINFIAAGYGGTPDCEYAKCAEWAKEKVKDLMAEHHHHDREEEER